MPSTRSTIAGAATGVAAALMLRRMDRSRRAAERFAAAALETLLNAIDANDPETGAHVRRVAAYSLIIAEELGLAEAERRTVERVAIFHDIGKLHEALFDIIHDQQPLTRAERRAIDTHPRRGAAVLAPLKSFYPDLPDGVLSHHEKWNGTGYPRQLKGRRIPLSARIVAIADTFDAITHRRPYRPGRSAEFARDVVLEGRGSQFDPELVDLFVFPPVFARVLSTECEVEKWVVPVCHRRPGSERDEAPDIIFRWRPRRRGACGPDSRDQMSRTARR